MELDKRDHLNALKVIITEAHGPIKGVEETVAISIGLMLYHRHPELAGKIAAEALTCANPSCSSDCSEVKQGLTDHLHQRVEEMLSNIQRDGLASVIDTLQRRSDGSLN